MRLGFLGMLIIGAVGIGLDDPGWALAYEIFALVGLVTAVIGGFCARCPYPYLYDDCLFYPAFIIREFIKNKTGKMPTASTLATGLVLAVIVFFPQAWLLNRPLLLILFWLVVIPMVLALPGYFCKQCLYGDCPFNRTEKGREDNDSPTL